jgi:NAD(P)-dependent dehydrogenase (short-subunit alcohol dehydrogenase family)
MDLRNSLKAMRNFVVDGRPKIVPSNLSHPDPSGMDHGLLSGKNVLITGAGRNIGQSIAIEMANQGANVFFTDIDKQRCQALAKELGTWGVQSSGYVSDISRIDDTDNLCRSLENADVRIDILVNNAGIGKSDPSKDDLDLQMWRKVYDTNVFGPMYLTKRIAQMMTSSHISGSIIFITSIHQWIIRRDSSYSSSKAALGMALMELALRLAPHGIRVNGIAPGWVAEDEQGETLASEYAPLNGSSINPRYIGRAAAYLSSDYYSKFTTGTVLTIDAGLSLYNHLVAQEEAG